MPRGKENLMALLHYPQKVTIIKILEKVDFKTDKKFRNHSFWDKKKYAKNVYFATFANLQQVRLWF